MAEYLKRFVRWLFVRSKPVDDLADVVTAPLSEVRVAFRNDVINEMKPPQFVIGSALSVGMEREHNEDSLYTFTANLAFDVQDLFYGFYAVADGMGGHKQGDVASEVAIRTISSHSIRKLYSPLFDPASLPLEDSLQEIMQEGIHNAHAAVAEKSPGGGATLTAALILGDRLTIAHAGDSRAYALHSDGRLELLTRDHSLVQRLIEIEQITPEEALNHPKQNELYRHLGQAEPFEADVFQGNLPAGGYLLLCSDGLWSVVPDDEISKVVATSPTPKAACENLVEAANKAGGPDNISVILIQIPENR